MNKTVLLIIRALLTAAFAAAGLAKLAGAEMMVQTFDAVGFGQWFRYVTGAIEVGSAIALWIPGLQAYAAAGQQLAAQAHAHVDALCREGSVVALDVRLVEDVTAVSGIVQTAETLGVDLIVIGSNGRSGIERLVLGSVAAKVVAQSSVPVLVAR